MNSTSGKILLVLLKELDHFKCHLLIIKIIKKTGTIFPSKSLKSQKQKSVISGNAINTTFRMLNVLHQQKSECWNLSNKWTELLLYNITKNTVIYSYQLQFLLLWHSFHFQCMILIHFGLPVCAFG